MSDRAIDPTTRDFVDAPGGAFADGDVLDNKVILSLSVELGAWEGDPLLGHRLGELQRAQDTSETLRRAEGFVRLALQWLLDSGEIATLDVTFERQDRGMYSFECDYTPPGGRPRTVGPFFFAVGASS